MTLRLFTGLAASEAWRQAAVAVQETIPGIRWSPPENLHVTLCFLGSLESSRVPELTRCLSGLTAARLSGLTLAAVTCWPAGVLVAEIAPHEELSALVAQQASALRDAGFALEGRHYRPHLTLARLKGDLDPLALDDWLSRHARLNASPSDANDYHLYHSRSSEYGVRYDPLLTLPLR